MKPIMRLFPVLAVVYLLGLTLITCQHHSETGQRRMSPKADHDEITSSSSTATSRVGITKFQIEGKVSMPKNDPKLDKNWQANTRILVNYGQHIGFVQYSKASNIAPGAIRIFFFLERGL